MYFVQKPSSYPFKWEAADQAGQRYGIISPQYGERYIQIVVKPAFVTYTGGLPLSEVGPALK